MPIIHQFEKEKLKPVVDLFLRTGADFEHKFPSQYKRAMRLILNENIPRVLLSDGFTFMEAVFTKESINEFRKNFSHLKFHLLRGKILYVQKWSLHLAQTPSDKSLCSFNNLAVYMTVE